MAKKKICQDPTVGRPPKVFTEKEINQVRILARCHCTDKEIAAYLECGETTLQRDFGALLKEARETGKANLRAWQFKLAEQGNATMQIWLGKQVLGQRDRHDLNVTNVEEEDFKRKISEMTPQQLAQLAEQEVAALKSKTQILANDDPQYLKPN